MESSPRDGQVSAEPTGSAVASRACQLPDCAARSFLAGRDAPRVYWTSPYGPEFAGGGSAARIIATDPNRFESVREDAADLFDGVEYDGPGVARPRLFGGFSFHDDHEALAPWRGFPPAHFVLPRTLLTRADGETWLTVSVPESAPETVDEELESVRERLVDDAPESRLPSVVATEPTATREEWAAQVRGAVERIERGDLRKVTLAQALSADLDGPVPIPDVLERLGESYPDCFRFLFEPTAEAGFFGATPERLATLRGRTVETDALAGSVGRGETDAEDERLEADLRDSEKMRHEHELVVETIRDQLGPLAGSVRVGDRQVRKLANIQHLWTPVEAEFPDDAGHVLSVAEALHPTPAVGGLPLEEALATIRAVESFDRGWYAAPVGWFDADGDGTFAVGLRSGVATDRRVTLFAGNGIVADSDPETEYEEVQLKYRPILDELQR
ncbi:isochorismate synthase [Halorussus marinus]|uniref:isochorismate synthase n=1 Tax=Halorussus marinus TaxID=2505976 RepID=UPI00106EA5D1|nr:isochorismate synthase [Halorussus marinus]